MKEKAVWNTIAWVSAIGMAWAARQAASALWSLVSDTDTPVNPADKDASWNQALAWAGLAGVLAGVARVLARRGAAMAWERATGEDPPGI